MTIEIEKPAAPARAVRSALPDLRDDERVTFAELVLAHHLRQTELYRAAQSGAPSDDLALEGPADKAYRDRLAAFERDHGKIVRAYWCTYAISGVAVTEQEVPLPWWRLRRTETRMRLHAETDWATRDAQELSHQLHKIDNLAVRADEVLRETSERIAMQLLLAAASHVLSYVDREDGPPPASTTRKVVAQSDAELAQIRRYYDRAGSNAARLVYAAGMLRGALFLAVLGGIAGLVLWAAGAFHRHSTTTWTILACLAAGGLGAAVSVLLRMARHNFSQDYEVGRKPTRNLAMARPFVGAAFAVLIFLGLKSGLMDVGGIANAKRTIFFYSAVGFLAGFSERWAKVLIGGALGGEDEPKDTSKDDDDEGDPCEDRKKDKPHR